MPASRSTSRRPQALVRLLLRRRGLELVRRSSLQEVEQGRVWPLIGETMIGMARLDNLQTCLEDALSRGVPGDVIETGVWRGGAAIFMRGLLRAQAVVDRRVWVADSFEGLPPPDKERYPADEGDLHHTAHELAIGEEVVRENFRRYGLLDDQVRFVRGWFRDTLPRLADISWAVIRIDGDMYESTMDSLVNLYPNLSPGGYVIIDEDYGNLPPCAQAVHDFRAAHGIRDPIQRIDWTGAYWRREG